MNKIETAIFATTVLIAVVVAIDMVVFIIKHAPKQAEFSRATWVFGALCWIALIYWYMNGMTFL